MLFTLKNGPLPESWYGPLSPLRATDGVQIELPCNKESLAKLLSYGVVPKPIPQEWDFMNQYLDIPRFAHLSSYMDPDKWDIYLWLHKLQYDDDDITRNTNQVRNWISKLISDATKTSSKLTADIAARYGQLETLKWLRSIGGEWTSDAADWAAMNGHLGTLRWIRENGGEWTHHAADWAAANGQLETLQWIVSNGGKRTYQAEYDAAMNGHVETLQWIQENGGDNADLRNGYAEVLGWMGNEIDMAWD